MSFVYSDHERALQLIRNKNIPTAPTTFDDIDKAFKRLEIYKQFCMTEHDDGTEIFLDTLYSDPAGQFQYCVFSSKKIIQYIKATRNDTNVRYLMDATFEIVPYGCFSQLLVIHVEKYGKVSIKFISFL